MAAGGGGEAFVTLATTDAYCMGATALARSLRRHGTTRKITVLVTQEVSTGSRAALQQVFDEVLQVEQLDSRDPQGLSSLGRPELGVTFTKLTCWTLLQYRKCVFLDADTLALCNVDELFEREELSAAPDPGWPDCFNSGVFVFRPSLDTHARLLEHARLHGSFDGGDQGLLNTFFSDWAVKDISKRLPFVYNLSASTVYSYLPALQQFGHNAKIVHFLGPNKPWNCRAGAQAEAQHTEHGTGRFVALWWKEYLSPTVPLQKTPSSGDAGSSHHQSLRGEAKASFKENLDASTSLLARFSVAQRTTPQPHTHTMRDTGVHRSQAEDLLLGNQRGTGKQDHPPGETQGPQDHPPGETQGPQDHPPGETQGPQGTSESSTQPTAVVPFEASQTEQQEQRRQWEEGQADYLGRHAFHNIQRKLDRFLE